MSRSQVQLKATIAAIFSACFAMLAAAPAAAETAPAEVRIGYSKHSPTSIVAQKFGWAEQEFAKSGTKVRWVDLAGQPASFDGVAAGTVDLLLSTTENALAARARGDLVKAIANPLVTLTADSEIFVATDKFVASFPSVLERAARLKIRVDAWVQKHPAEASQLSVEIAATASRNDATLADARQDFRLLAAKLVAHGSISRETSIETLLDGLLHLEPASRIAALYPNGTTR